MNSDDTLCNHALLEHPLAQVSRAQWIIHNDYCLFKCNPSNHCSALLTTLSQDVFKPYGGNTSPRWVHYTLWESLMMDSRQCSTPLWVCSSVMTMVVRKIFVRLCGVKGKFSTSYDSSSEPSESRTFFADALSLGTNWFHGPCEGQTTARLDNLARISTLHHTAPLHVFQRDGLFWSPAGPTLVLPRVSCHGEIKLCWYLWGNTA